MNEKRATKGYKRLQKAARAASCWRKIAQKYDWWGRAEAWDADRRVSAMKAVTDSLNLVRFAAQEAVQFQIDLMRGKVRLINDDGGELNVLLTLDEIQQMRLASNSILNRAGVIYDGPMAGEDDGAVEVIGIKIQGSDGKWVDEV